MKLNSLTLTWRESYIGCSHKMTLAAAAADLAVAAGGDKMDYQSYYQQPKHDIIP